MRTARYLIILATAFLAWAISELPASWLRWLLKARPKRTAEDKAWDRWRPTPETARGWGHGDVENEYVPFQGFSPRVSRPYGHGTSSAGGGAYEEYADEAAHNRGLLR